MARSISPIKKITRLDRIQKIDLYRAVDFQEERPRYLHLSGESLTTNKFYSWMGTKPQFRAICKKYEWDGFCLVPITKIG